MIDLLTDHFAWFDDFNMTVLSTESIETRFNTDRSLSTITDLNVVLKSLLSCFVFALSHLIALRVLIFFLESYLRFIIYASLCFSNSIREELIIDINIHFLLRSLCSFHTSNIFFSSSLIAWSHSIIFKTSD